MKPLKYTVAALALIAVASFTQSAMASGSTTAATGDLLLGIYDTSNTVTTSYELDLGAFSSLTPGETFNLGTTASSQFSSAPAGDLAFDIAGAGANLGSATDGGLAAKEIAFVAANPPAEVGSNSSQYGGLATMYSEYNSANTTGLTLPSSTSSTGTAISAVSDSNSDTGSFANEAPTATYGEVGTLPTYPSDSTDFTLYTKLNNSTTLTDVGTFVFSDVGGNDILTFEPLATPEPSAYALGLCAVALFFVLKRRSSVA